MQKEACLYGLEKGDHLHQGGRKAVFNQIIKAQSPSKGQVLGEEGGRGEKAAIPGGGGHSPPSIHCLVVNRVQENNSG